MAMMAIYHKCIKKTCYMSSTFQGKKEKCKREHKYQNGLNRRKNICELEDSNLKVPSHRRTKKESDRVMKD